MPLFIVATVGLALAWQLYWIVLGLRLLQGIGGTMLQVSTYALCTSSFPEKLGTMLGYVHGFMGAGLLLGPAIGGLLYEALGFRGALLVLSGLASISLVGLVMFMSSDSNPRAAAEGREENPIETKEGGEEEEANGGNGDGAQVFCSTFLTLRAEMQWPLAAMLATASIVGLMEAMLPLHLEASFKYDSSVVGALIAMAVCSC